VAGADYVLHTSSKGSSARSNSDVVVEVDPDSPLDSGGEQVRWLADLFGARRAPQ